MHVISDAVSDSLACPWTLVGCGGSGVELRPEVMSLIRSCANASAVQQEKDQAVVSEVQGISLL